MTHICVVPLPVVKRLSAEVLPPLDPKTQALSALIGKKLKKAREKAELSQEDLGLRAKMTRTSYARIEKGQTNVTIDSLVRIADGLGLSVDIRFTRPKSSE